MLTILHAEAPNRAPGARMGLADALRRPAAVQRAAAQRPFFSYRKYSTGFFTDRFPSINSRLTEVS